MVCACILFWFRHVLFLDDSRFVAASSRVACSLPSFFDVVTLGRRAIQIIRMTTRGILNNGVAADTVIVDKQLWKRCIFRKDGVPQDCPCQPVLVQSPGSDRFLDTMDYWQGVLSRLKEDSRYMYIYLILLLRNYFLTLASE